MLLHAGESHVERLGKVRDRGVCTPELLQNAAPGGVRERGERGIEAGLAILNHSVQYVTHRLGTCKRSRARAALPGRLPDLVSRALLPIIHRRHTAVAMPSQSVHGALPVWIRGTFRT